MGPKFLVGESKWIRLAKLDLAEFSCLAFLVKRKLVFDGTVGEEDAVEVVKFVLEDAGGEARKFTFLPLAIEGLPAEVDPLAAGDVAPDTRNGKTAF